MSAATLNRIESGEKIPTDEEIILIAAALALDASILMNAFNQDRIAHALLEAEELYGGTMPRSQLFQDQEALVKSMETQRMFSKPEYAVMLATAFIERWEPMVDVHDQMYRIDLQRILAQVRLTRVYAMSLTINGPRLVQYLRRDQALTHTLGYLALSDTRYQDMAKFLPGMLAYLAQDYAMALDILTHTLPEITDEYVYILGMRDAVVAAGRLEDKAKFSTVAAQAHELLQAAQIQPIEKARLWEGLAMAENNLGGKNADAYIYNALQEYETAEKDGEVRPAIESQIARTEVQLAVTGSYSEEKVFDHISERIRIFYRNGCSRYLAQIKQLLRTTKSSQLQTLALSV